ncbi:MAG: choice-of-anchor L domain-containing protein [Flavobacterium sp.]|nr:choice-of-anchor L domain-containing protein [Flavobacterium sp.]
MNWVRCLFYTLLLTIPVLTANAQYITVSENQTPQQLVENVLVTNACANVSSITVSNSWNSGSGNSFGYFSANGSSFPFNEGIILSTGKAISAIGPNADILSEGPSSWPGDTDLEQALNVNNSINATVLEFDFLPLGNKISFDYIFASEQYLTNPSQNQCSYTDGFVFLLRKANTNDAYQNLAVIPNTNIPVKVNTVRGPGTVCPAANAQYFAGFNGYEHPTNYNGQTVALTAEATVEPNQLYHIKLVVADQGNNLYDSAIFLGGGSFKIEKDLGPDRLIATGNALCSGESLQLDASDPAGTAYKWFLNGNEISGETNPVYNVTSPGDYSVEITLNASACVSTGEITVEFAPLPILNDPALLLQCDVNNDGITTFNLTSLDDIIRNNDPNLGPVSYFLTMTDAQNNANPIANPESFTNTASSQLVAAVSNPSGCRSYATVNLQVANNTITAQPQLSICDNDNDGLASFSLSDADSLITNGLPAGLSVQYFLSSSDAVNQINPLSQSFNNTMPFLQTIYARVVNGTDCFGIVPVDLRVNVISTSALNDETISICEGTAVQLTAPGGFTDYSWNTTPNQVTTSIIVTDPGVYTVEVTDGNGCTASKSFTVTVSEPPTFISADISDFAGFGNSVLINYSGNGLYEFSLDGNFYQTDPYFTGLRPGEYFIYIRDTNNCGNIGPIAIYVLDTPAYFTPNGDGRNDVWFIPYLQLLPESRVTIYDRFGKLLYGFGGDGNGWNGKLNGQELPATDYWFVAELSDGRTIKGHFALKR